MSERFNQLHNLIEKYFEIWIPIMGLEHWSINRKYIPSTCVPSPDRVMGVNDSWEYKQLGVAIYLPTVDRIKDRQIEGVVVHELCHPMVSFLRNKKSKVYKEERVVTELAAAFLRARYPNIDPSEFIC